MKIEDIKPDDVIVRTEDKILFKVVEVTPDRQIMQSANGKMNEVFCIFQEPQPMVLCSMDDYEPATEEQREYMESKLAAFNGTNPEVESKRITALASIMGDLKQENNELAERVKQLTEDNSRLARFENSEFVSMNCYCYNYRREPFGVDVYVGSTTCQKCEHFMKINNTGDGTVLCAYRYDKEKEKQQERNRYLNEK